MKPLLRPRSGLVGCDAFRVGRPIVVHVCVTCMARQATYEGVLPRGWSLVNGRGVCRACRRAVR